MQSQLLAQLTSISLRTQALRQLKHITSLPPYLCLAQGAQQLPSLQLWHRQLHADASTSPAALAGWVQQQGGSVEGVNVQPAGGGAGYGLWSSKELQSGTCLVHLPKQCQLTYDSHTQPELLELIEAVPPALWGARLALQVLAHRVRGPDSPFSLYISNLPVGVSGVPMFFPREALSAIEYAPVTQQVRMRCQWLLHFAQGALQPLPGTPKDPFAGITVDANALGWALAVVTSRAFRVAGPSQPAAMLPLIDMCNHTFHPNCTLKAQPNGDFQLVTLQEIAANQPLTLSYGSLSNDFLLMDYGFVVPNNPFDRVQLSFSLQLMEAGKELAGVRSFQPWSQQSPSASSSSAALPLWQEQALTQLGLLGPHANPEVAIGGDPCVDPRLLAAARILYCQDPSELQSRALVQLGAWGMPLNPANEVRSLRTLAAVCTVSLSQFSSVAPEDQQMLKLSLDASGQPLSNELQLAMQFRLEKKRLLLHAINEIGKQIQALAKQDPFRKQ